jgi:hypothetical protein
MTAALVLVGWSATTAAGTPRRGDVSVRVYDHARLNRSVLDEALSGVSTALTGAGVTVRWTQCPTRGHVDPACGTPLGAGELAVRIVMLPAPDKLAGNVPLADSLIDNERHQGVLATIYFDRVQGMALTAGTSVGVLLGRTIAHEIEHLLAGNDAHETTGLMRGTWTAHDLRSR